MLNMCIFLRKHNPYNLVFICLPNYHSTMRQFWFLRARLYLKSMYVPYLNTLTT